MRTIDLNADVGEGVGDDATLIPLVTSANIACGAHAGDDVTIEAAVAAAVEAGIAIGAHPGHADREGFGRRAVPLTAAELLALVAPQVERLRRVAQKFGAPVRYVKLHGALYHQAAADPALASATARAVLQAGPDLYLLGPPQTKLAEAAQAAGVPFAAEGFADRRYQADGTLAPRSTPGAVLDDPGVAAEQAVRIAVRGDAVAACGDPVGVPCESLCLHGDQPNAATIATKIREALANSGVEVRPFVAPLPHSGY